MSTTEEKVPGTDPPWFDYPVIEETLEGVFVQEYPSVKAMPFDGVRILMLLGRERKALKYRPKPMEVREGEQWRVFGGDPELMYEVSDLGRLRFWHQSQCWVEIKPTKREDGHFYVSWKKKGKNQGVTVESIVASKFISFDLTNKVIEHLDGDFSNNKVSNLFVRRVDGQFIDRLLRITDKETGDVYLAERSTSDACVFTGYKLKRLKEIVDGDEDPKYLVEDKGWLND